MWWTSVAYYFLQFKTYIYTGLAAGFLLAGFLFLACRKMSFRQPAFTLHAYFYGMSSKNLLRLAFAINKELLILTLLVTRQRLGIWHITALFLLGLGISVPGKKVLPVLLEVLNTGAVCAGLYVCQMLYSYLTNIRFSMDILMTWFLLGMFLVIYTMIFFLNGIAGLGMVLPAQPGEQKEKKRKRRKKESNTEKGDAGHEV